MDKVYICIDLKTFFASVECVERGLDPFKTKLVVADEERGNGTICLAVSPKMKELGVRNRCRLFEVPSNLDFIIAKPRMKKYIEYSANIYGIYLKYIDKNDIHVYSIDECFIDVTKYLKLYKKDVYQIANMLIDDVYNTYGITATVGIGPNLFLAKVALDISAKHKKTNIAYLDEDTFKETLWDHTPLTDFWQIGRGIQDRLQKHNIYTLKQVSECDPVILYKEFGINAEILIDHSKGIEPTTIAEIKKYKSKNNSISYGQVLFEDYTYDEAFLVMKEMVELACLDLIDKHLVTNHISLGIGYSNEKDKFLGVSLKIIETTNSYRILNEYFVNLYKSNVNPRKLIRRVNIGFGNVISDEYKTINLFDDEQQQQKEKNLQETIIALKKKFGKNAILKGMNLEDKATTISRNKLVGGHNEE